MVMPVPGEPAHRSQHLADKFRIQRARRLVEQASSSAAHRQGGAICDPLLLTAREMTWIGIAFVVSRFDPAASSFGFSITGSDTAHMTRCLDNVLQHRSKCGNRLNCWKPCPLCCRWRRIADCDPRATPRADVRSRELSVE